MKPGEEPNFQHLLQQAQQLQEQLVNAQAELAEAEVTGAAGGGLVTATVSGSGELKSLDIDPSVVDPEDVETLADLVVAAVRSATAEAKRVGEQKLGPIAGGLGGPGGLPGLGG